MKAGRYATSRQKSCQSCSNAKAKCDRKAGGCTRCSQRGLFCNYRQDSPSGRSSHGLSSGNGHVSSSILCGISRFPSNQNEYLLNEQGIGEGQLAIDIGSAESTDATISPFHSPETVNENYAHAARPYSADTLDFTDIDLVCPINAEDIRNRWLNAFVPGPNQAVKQYPTAVSAFIYRILQSYVAVTVRGRGVPPFIHASQTLAATMVPQLSTCLTLVRMCESPLPGSESAAMEVLQREMNSIHEKYEECDTFSGLASFQAYLIYSMVLFFKLRHASNSASNTFLRQAIMTLQTLASSTSHQGLTCPEDQTRTRPKWEAWIIAEAKRRTLFMMYMFDSVLSCQDGLPTYLGVELEGLLAPQGKHLWEAKTRREWEEAYNLHVMDWGEEGALRIEELWPVPEGLGERGLRERRRRVDLWLEDVDEFGTMMYAVTSCTHGG